MTGYEIREAELHALKDYIASRNDEEEIAKIRWCIIEAYSESIWETHKDVILYARKVAEQGYCGGCVSLFTEERALELIKKIATGNHGKIEWRDEGFSMVMGRKTYSIHFREDSIFMRYYTEGVKNKYGSGKDHVGYPCKTREDKIALAKLYAIGEA